MTNRDPYDPDASRPRSEPEIIPPGRPGRNQRGGVWVSIDENGDTQRIYVRPLGPFTILLALAILGFVGVLMLIVLLSVAVVWIPVVMALIAAFVVSIYWRRFKLWLAGR